MPRNPFAPPDHDTAIGGAKSEFPETHRSLVAEVASSNAETRALAYPRIVESYWKPVYKYIRIKWNRSNEDAKDLTQAFFTGAIEKSTLAGYDPAKASFRTFIRSCVDHFVSNTDRAASRLKRGGDSQHLALDFEGAEAELGFSEPAADFSMDEYFRHEWVRQLFELAINQLEFECLERNKSLHFKLFELYDIDHKADGSVSYQSLADRFQISTTDVNNYLAFARREFRKIATARLRELTGTDEEFRAEARQLLGVKVQ